MSLYETILSDWTAAVKARDSARSLALSNIKAALLSRAIELGARKTGLTEDQASSVLHKLQKQSEDAILSLPDSCDLKVKEQYELSIISSYLPKRLSSEETRKRVWDILSNAEACDLGTGMKLCLSELKNISDGKQVQSLVKQFIEEKRK